VSKLRDLAQKRFSSKGNQIDLILRHSLKTNIERLRISIDCAIKYRRNEDGDHQQKVDKLRKDVINSVRHVFGQHDLCEEYFCKGPKPQEQNLIPLMEKCGLYNDVIASANRLAHHSSSLIRNMTNNSAENYNSVLAKFIGGKRVDYSKKGAYGMRCNLAGLSINYNDKFYARLHTAITHKRRLR
jgi:Mg2+ and Co2+ transporter CorA